MIANRLAAVSGVSWFAIFRYDPGDPMWISAHGCASRKEGRGRKEEGTMERHTDGTAWRVGRLMTRQAAVAVCNEKGDGATISAMNRSIPDERSSGCNAHTFIFWVWVGVSALAFIIRAAVGN